MRRYFLAATILSIVAGGPLQALAGDREIAEQIISKLKVQRDAGSLKDFTLDLKVDKGVVLMRGSVREDAQKRSVLAVAKDIDGIAKVVDEITVLPVVATPAQTATPAPTATVIKPKAAVTPVNNFSIEKALTAAPPVTPQQTFQSPVIAQASRPAAWQPSSVEMAAATESTVASDRDITAAIVGALSNAQRNGQLKGYGVDVNTQDGRVFLNGRASTEEHRQLITSLAEQVPGVTEVVDEIAVYTANVPVPLNQYGSGPGTPAQAVSQRTPVNAQAVPYPMQQGMGTPAMAAGMNGGYAGVAGTPMPMAPYAGGQAAPRYEQPNLPNYAWPGYAAYPNYAAVTYPQQYSPSAWPYIGPFYPYPQVPLGWRKVSLEWDDGWWMLDFTDK